MVKKISLASDTPQTKDVPNDRPIGQRWLIRFKRRYPLLLIALGGFLVGILWLAGIRFLVTKPQETHYHANYAVYINGVREEYKSFTYYEEEVACTNAYSENPKGRVHMHDNENDIIHVHDKRVTWADFFHNIDWGLGKDYLATDHVIYQTNDSNTLTFILNGEKVSRIDDKVIGDQDKLLISYDIPTADYMTQYNKIENKAEEEDKGQDPASCSGLNGPAQSSARERLKRAFFGA